MSKTNLFTSESVSEGHPDKVADQISDSIVDAIFKEDSTARIACEAMINTGMVVLSGEITTSANIDYETIARSTIREIGYTSDAVGFDSDKCQVLISIDKQSPDIAQGVNEGEGEDLDQGAGDQGLMFGYACSETPVLMPAPINLSHELVLKQSEVRKNGELSWLRPDAKSQVSVVYKDDRKTVDYVSAIVLSTQHDEDISQDEIKAKVREKIINPIIPTEWIKEDTKIYINPTGKFVIGGPVGDCGLTGRKIIVDTYGGMARHGGGAFSGKDPSKVDRSAAYACRYVAKNIVATGLAERCEVQVSYAIGIAEPTSITVDTLGTGNLSENEISQIVRDNFDLRPKNLINLLDLKRPIYKNTASYGHFGRENKDFSWENTDISSQIK